MKYLLCVNGYRNGAFSESYEYADFAEAVKQFNDWCADYHVESATLADLEKKTIIRQFIYRNDRDDTIPVLL